MHETTMAACILNSAERVLSSQANNSNGVDDLDAKVIVSIAIGEFRNVDPESLMFAYDALKQDHARLKNSQLDIVLIKATAICQGSGHVYHPKADTIFRCPQCACGIDKLIEGEELEIRGLEILEADNARDC